MAKRIFSLGIDLGGTGVKLGIVDQRGKLSDTSRFATPIDGDPRAVVDLIVFHAQKLLLNVRARVKGIGIGCAGDIDPVKGLVRISPNLGWRNVPIKALLSRKLRYPVTLANDANVAAWAAYVIEAKRRVKNLLCVTLGTGIGGGIVIDGKLYGGATGSAGEIGHMTLYPDGIPCKCGNRGCLERYIGARDLSAAARRAIESGEQSLITRLVQGELEHITPLIIQQAALKGDRLALTMYEEAGERLGIGLASVVNMLNPDWIVLSGGISRAGRVLLDPIRRTLHQRAFPTPASAVKLFISRQDQDLGMVGAGLIAHGD